MFTIELYDILIIFSTILSLLSSSQLFHIRKHILTNEGEFEALIADERFKKIFNEVLGDKNKRVESIFSEIAQRNQLIMNKEFYYFTKLDIPESINEDFIDYLIALYASCRNLNTFFIKAIGN